MNFPNLTRRGFVAAASAMAASIAAAMSLPPGVKLLNETDNEEPVNLSKDWITDKGDYYIVHVPEGKTFRNELLDKSTIFYIENGASVRGVSINGFVNAIVLNEFADFSHNVIDTSKTRLASGKERSAVVLSYRGRSIFFEKNLVSEHDTRQLVMQDPVTKYLNIRNIPKYPYEIIKS